VTDDTRFSADSADDSDENQPAPTALMQTDRGQTEEWNAAEGLEAPLSEHERKQVAEKLWAWEQQQFPVKGPRLRLRSQGFRPYLSTKRILAWADAHHRATGDWPTVKSGLVRDSAHGDTWAAVDSALNLGWRGLPGGSTLGQLLAQRRGVRPALTIERLLAWADAHHAATGQWPTRSSGPVRGVYRERWSRVDHDLREGRRGLPGGTTLARVLAAHRGARNVYTMQPLTHEQILAWADAHHAANGRWPSSDSGKVAGAPGETWSAINTALAEGGRGLTGKMTLSRLLVAHRGRSALNGRPELTVEKILAWADAYHAAHGRWPVEDSGAVEGATGETWGALSQALLYGRRGLAGGSSLARLLDEHRGVRNPRALPTLTLVQILAWADAHHAAHGEWPSGRSGPVADAPDEDWGNLDLALRKGFRGLPGGMTLAKLLTERRPEQRGRLTVARVRAWAEHHRRLTGRWPYACAGPVLAAPDEDWHSINLALRDGRRGLPAGLSLRKLFGRTCDPAAQGRRPWLAVEQLLAWADAHHGAHGRWPTRISGPIAGAPGEKWVNIDMALRHGRRGLPSRMSLAQFLALHRGPAPDAATVIPTR
jgi:hypothetical protein